MSTPAESLTLPEFKPFDMPTLVRTAERFGLEALGADVAWDPRTRSITAVRGQDSLLLTIDSRAVEWRRSLIKVDAAPVIANGRTLVPLRLVGQALGLHVRWDGSTRTVHLETNPGPVRSSPEQTGPLCFVMAIG